MALSKGQVNLSPVMDLYNGEIIAWHSATRASFDLISSMLKKAFSRLTRGERPLLHSDQGWQYQMPAYRRLLDQRAVQQSMSRKGNCLDNAAMESFFGTLKAEFFHLNEFDSVEQLQAGIRQYIRYYNHERIRLKLKALSPVQYRTQPCWPSTPEPSNFWGSVQRARFFRFAASCGAARPARARRGRTLTCSGSSARRRLPA
ncbi:hypothetical protein BMMON2_27680 [Burkholderia mallei]